MKVMVPVKRVVDPYVKIQVKSDRSQVETNNVKMAMNPFDEIALEEAVRLLEKGIVSEIIAVSIGVQACQETLRQALAFGATTAIHVHCETALEPLGVAKVLHKIVSQQKIDWVIMGKQAIDDDCNQTGQMLAAFLNWPQATFASKLTVAEDKKSVDVTREVDGGLEILNCQFPCVITTDLRLNEPRYLGLPSIMKAKKKTIDVLELSSLNVDTKARWTVNQVNPPKGRSAGVLLQNVKELVQTLRDKEKVI